MIPKHNLVISFCARQETAPVEYLRSERIDADA